MGFCALAGKEAKCSDRLILIIGILSATLFGCSMPALYLLFAQLIDNFGGSATSEEQIEKNFKAM